MKRNIGFFLLGLIVIALLGACSPKEEEDDGAIVMDINEVYSDVKKEFGDDYLPEKSLNLEEVSELTGIDKDGVIDFIAEVPMINLNVDTFIAIEAETDKAYDIAQSLLAYKKYLEEEAFQYPMNIAKIKASKVERKGDYVFFTMLGAPNEMEDQDSPEALEFSQKQVRRVEIIINKSCGWI